MGVTSARAGRASAVLAAFQSAKGTLATNFSAGALYADEAPFEVDRDNEYPELMDAQYGAAVQYELPEQPSGELPVIATPTSLATLLRSNLGAPTAGTYPINTQVADTDWLTLAYVEHVGDGTQKLIRVRDAWVPRLELRAKGPQDRVTAHAHYEGVVTDVRAVTGSGCTLPAAPMLPSDRDVFPAQRASLTANGVAIRFRELALSLDQRVQRFWRQDTLVHDVAKGGKLRATVSVVGDWCDEAWQIRADMIAQTPRTWVFSLTSEAGRTLTATLYNALPHIEATGRLGLKSRAFEATGHAISDGTNFFTLVTT